VMPESALARPGDQRLSVAVPVVLTLGLVVAAIVAWQSEQVRERTHLLELKPTERAREREGEREKEGLVGSNWTWLVGRPLPAKATVCIN
jgi:hypothetical protein